MDDGKIFKEISMPDQVGKPEDLPDMTFFKDEQKQKVLVREELDHVLRKGPGVKRTTEFHVSPKLVGLKDILDVDGRRHINIRDVKSGNIIDIKDFTSSAGTLSNLITITGFTFDNGPYGVEFSSDSSKLYISDGAQGKIYQFDLKITKKGKVITFHGDSNKLTEEMHVQLKQLSVGDEFTFKNTKAKLPKKGTVDVWAKKFTIV